MLTLLDLKSNGKNLYKLINKTIYNKENNNEQNITSR